MKLSTIIPDFLLSDHKLLAVYCYCLRLAQPENTKILTNGQVVTLRPYEVFIALNKSVLDLKMGEQIIEDAIKKLSDLELIEFSCEGDSRKIRFKYIVLPSTEQKNKSGTVTDINDCWFDEFIPEYLEYVKTNMSYKTYINYLAMVNAFSKWLGRRKISDITGSDLEKYKNAKKGTVSDNTINIHVRTLKASLELAVTWGKVKENPFKNVKQIRIQKRSTPSLQKDEYDLLRCRISEQWLINLIDFDILTGLRLGELCNLKWSDIDMDKGIITIESDPQYRVKHGKMRTLPLHNEAKAILSMIKRTGEYVFVKEDGTRPSDQFISKKFKSYIREVGLSEEYHFHSLRATFASWCANNGISVYNIKNFMGHSSVQVTESYTSPDVSNMRRELSKLSLVQFKEAA